MYFLKNKRINDWISYFYYNDWRGLSGYFLNFNKIKTFKQAQIKQKRTFLKTLESKSEGSFKGHSCICTK